MYRCTFSSGFTRIGSQLFPKLSRTFFCFFFVFRRSIIFATLINHKRIWRPQKVRNDEDSYESRNVIGKFWPLANLDRNLEIHYPSSIRDDLASRFARGWNHRPALERGVIKLESAADTSSSAACLPISAYISPLTTRSLVKLWYNRNINRMYHSCPALPVARSPKDKSRANVVRPAPAGVVARSRTNVGQRVEWIRKARINTLISGRS